jgi:hypothetical protein
MPLFRPSEKAATSAPVVLGMISVRTLGQVQSITTYSCITSDNQHSYTTLSILTCIDEIKLQKEIFVSTCWFVNSLHHANLDPHLDQVLNP